MMNIRWKQKYTVVLAAQEAQRCMYHICKYFVYLYKPKKLPI